MKGSVGLVGARIQAEGHPFATMILLLAVKPSGIRRADLDRHARRWHHVVRIGHEAAVDTIHLTARSAEVGLREGVVGRHEVELYSIALGCVQSLWLESQETGSSNNDLRWSASS